MNSLSPIELGLFTRLKKDRAFRRRFFEQLAQDEVAMQIRALRLKAGFTRQADFAREAKMQQSAVSRIESANYRGWSYRTLLRVAAALDARLRITFEPAERAVSRYRPGTANAVDVTAANTITTASTSAATTTGEERVATYCSDSFVGNIQNLGRVETTVKAITLGTS
jgi:transcriptional regulator with XRE-family HTH domain